VFERTHGSQLCFALFVWFARAAQLVGIAQTTTGKANNECKALGQLGLVCVQMLGHKCSFPNRPFVYSVVGNNERSSSIEGKTSNCLSRNYLYSRYIELRFC